MKEVLENLAAMAAEVGHPLFGGGGEAGLVLDLGQGAGRGLQPNVIRRAGVPDPGRRAHPDQTTAQGRRLFPPA
jgi:hypothetical protein